MGQLSAKQVKQVSPSEPHIGDWTGWVKYTDKASWTSWLHSSGWMTRPNKHTSHNKHIMWIDELEKILILSWQKLILVYSLSKSYKSNIRIIIQYRFYSMNKSKIYLFLSYSLSILFTKSNYFIPFYSILWIKHT